MEQELIELGYEVELCEINMEEEDLEERLSKYIGKTFRAVIDFNSRLQRIEMDNGERYLDQINAPFYNYIVDHPLYHHPVIKLPLKNSNIICIDRQHEKYIKEYYLDIKKVVFMPLGAMEALNYIPYEERQIDVVFLGTYTSSTNILEQIKEMDYPEETLALLQELKNNTSQTQEEAFGRILERRKEKISSKEFAERLNACYLADKYLRAFYREKLIQTLIMQDIDVTIYGYGWERFECEESTHLKIREDISFPVSLEVIADSKIVLNIMPWFKDGIHDRILSAMINQAVCVTDSCSYVDEQFLDEEDLILYSLEEMDKLPSRIKQLLTDEKRAKEIAECGYRKVKEKHMWKNRIQENIDKIQ